MGDTENPAITSWLETLERHAYMRLVEYIDADRLDAARQLVEVLKGVGVI